MLVLYIYYTRNSLETNGRIAIYTNFQIKKRKRKFRLHVSAPHILMKRVGLPYNVAKRSRNALTLMSLDLRMPGAVKMVRIPHDT